MTPITWTNETRKLSQLLPWEHNPRRITEKQAVHLQTSIRKFGFALPYLISPENNIYDGHQRKALMGIMQEYGHDADFYTKYQQAAAAGELEKFLETKVLIPEEEYLKLW